MGGYAFVAFTALACGPVYSLAFADLLFPGGRDFGQVVGPAKGCTRTIGAMYRDDGSAGQLHVGVQRFDGGIVPLLDLGQENVGNDFTGRSEEHTSELQSLMRISYAVFCLEKKKTSTKNDRDSR